MHDILIWGGGPAGLSAAIYAARAGLKALVVEGLVPGGQASTAYEIDNYAGLERIGGSELGMNMLAHAQTAGAQVEYTQVDRASLDGPVKRLYAGDAVFEGKTIIIATGAAHKSLGVPGESDFVGRGVSYCATCDGNFFKGREVAVIGGGNTAVKDALYLARLCSRVYIVHRRDTLRAVGGQVTQLTGLENVTAVMPATVRSIAGDATVDSLVLDTPAGSRTLGVSGVFVAVGSKPNTSLCDGVTLDESGYIVAGEDCRTNLPGVFCAGDVRTKPLRQVICAASDGAVAATAAGAYLQS